uniref:DUF2971 domain-containing protein n=1 Tax=Tanacetum cinerariifolium TaxID=118510 RepID=A0A699JKJ7_TANCI|nr:hypothetical protein [Tanacetum cinerariifolium]
MLTDKQLWFSHPSKFNDPFDTQINLEHYLEEIRDDIEIKHVNDIILLAKAYLPNHEEYLKSRFLYCANRQEDGFNPFEEVLMWSHYANEHRGICIGLSMDSVRGSLPQTGYFSVDKEVTYGAESFAQETAQYLRFLPSFSLLRDEFNAKDSAPIHNIRTKPLYISRLFDAFSFVKSKNWAYEHEHRFALDNGTAGAGALVDFDPTDLENIIFGLNTIDSDKATIMNLLTAPEWTHVEVWQAKRGAGIFKLDFDRIK